MWGCHAGLALYVPLFRLVRYYYYRPCCCCWSSSRGIPPLLVQLLTLYGLTGGEVSMLTSSYRCIFFYGIKFKISPLLRVLSEARSCGFSFFFCCNSNIFHVQVLESGLLSPSTTIIQGKDCLEGYTLLASWTYSAPMPIVEAIAHSLPAMLNVCKRAKLHEVI